MRHAAVIKSVRLGKLSLRAHNFNSETLKVNDKRGNPVEIAAVVVWRVENTAQAVFDVENYESYVQVQSESALRSIASLYAYDHGEEHEVTLRGGGDEVARRAARRSSGAAWRRRASSSTKRASRTSPTRPRSRQAMLRRQQAEAVIVGARRRSCTAP